MSEEGDIETLRARARALATPHERADVALGGGEVIVFRVRRASYAVATEVVVGVRKLDAISPAPRGVSIAGLSVVDGEIVSVVRLDSVGADPRSEASLAVVLGVGRPELAILVDEVQGLRPRDDPDRGGAEAVVLLDGVALLQSRAR